MRCTIPTYRDKISDWEDEYTDYYRTLRHDRQLAVNNLVKHINRHSMAGSLHDHHTPELVYLVSICVGHQHEIPQLREEFDEVPPEEVTLRKDIIGYQIVHVREPDAQ